MTARAERAGTVTECGPQGLARRTEPDRTGLAEQAGQTNQTDTRLLDRWTLGALCLHLLLAGVLLAAPQPKTISGLDQGGRGGGSQMVELTLGGPGGKRPAAATPRTPTPAPLPVPQVRDVKPDAKAVSTRKRDAASRPTPAERQPERPAAPTSPTEPSVAPARAMTADAAPSGGLDTSVPEGAPPGSGGTDKGMAFGSGGGTGGGSTGTAGPGGVGLHADTARDGDYDRKARPLYAPQPPYPAEARRKRAEGVVVVRLHIDPQGRVASRSVVGGEAVDLFADAALSTVERWRFRPCGRDGRDVACEVEVPVVFKLVR